VAIIGRGKVGIALTRALTRAGVAARSIGRTLPPQIEADVVLLAVPDAQIARVASQLSTRAAVLHCAGARGLDELEALRSQGASVGVLHPLLSFASARHPPSFHGATFTVFGERRAVQAARKLARVLGAHALVLAGPPTAAYHAAAALLANGAVALAHHAAHILSWIPARERQRALAGLLASVANNVAHVGLPDALTGPVVRGDVAAVQRHLAALSPAQAQAYAAVLPLIIATAREAGLPPAQARALAAVQPERPLSSPGSRPRRATRSPRRPRTKASR
ncbi:MAG TPA: Rossmann-like and DUF2520 domain-containing protein, partial [Polyangiales bacterium]